MRRRFAKGWSAADRCGHLRARLTNRSQKNVAFQQTKVFDRHGQKKNIPEGLWLKCPVTGEIIFKKELEQNQMVVPRSGYHFPIEPARRLEFLLDPGSFEEKDAGLASLDFLSFRETSSYADKLQENRKKTGAREAVLCGTGSIHGAPVSIAVMDFAFMGASMGSVVG